MPNNFVLRMKKKARRNYPLKNSDNKNWKKSEKKLRWIWTCCEFSLQMTGRCVVANQLYSSCYAFIIQFTFCSVARYWAALMQTHESWLCWTTTEKIMQFFFLSFFDSYTFRMLAHVNVIETGLILKEKKKMKLKNELTRWNAVPAIVDHSTTMSVDRHGINVIRFSTCS